MKFIDEKNWEHATFGHRSNMALRFLDKNNEDKLNKRLPRAFGANLTAITVKLDSVPLSSKLNGCQPASRVHLS